MFDSSAGHNGVSQTKVLPPGPDLMNSLVDVRRETIAVVCDTEQMFHSFHFASNTRLLTFLSFKDNDLHKQIVEYLMNIHLFSNGLTSAMATFGFRKTITDSEKKKEGRQRSSFVKIFMSTKAWLPQQRRDKLLT